MDLVTQIDRALEGRRLLSHPFYRRWEAGELKDGELAAYGSQYEHFERQLPSTLQGILDDCDLGASRDVIQSSLDDELGSPRPHVELLGSFLDAVGAEPAAATPATAALVELYKSAAARGAAFAVGVVAGYELQAAQVARTKAEGLRRFYGLSDVGTEFWDVHAEMDETHGSWMLDAASSLDAGSVLAGVDASAAAWWRFLDERDGASLDR
jgi:pyrroloquinoline-quinone synthase